MGTLIGHVGPGVAFVIIGLWHLFNTMKNYFRCRDFKTRAWFPTEMKGFLKYTELIAIMAGSCVSILMELIICPEKHHPFDEDDWSIPSDHLNNFEHSSISMYFLIYAAVALFVEIRGVQLPEGLLHVIGALAFSQELLLFHLHSADHVGIEGQYHFLLQLIVFGSFCCTLLEIACPRSFVVPMVRSMSIIFQGCWFVHIGSVLWVPRFVPKGCEMQRRDGHLIVTCANEEAAARAKALANLQFNWFLAGIVVFTVIMYVLMARRFTHTARYQPLSDRCANQGTQDDVEMGSPYKNYVDDTQQALNLQR